MTSSKCHICYEGAKPLPVPMMKQLTDSFSHVHVFGTMAQWVNTLRPRQDGRYFADDVLKCIFLNENVWISLKIPLKFVPRGPINNIPALVQIMAWRRPGDKPLSEPMMISLLTHICVTRPQWVNSPSCNWYFSPITITVCLLMMPMLSINHMSWQNSHHGNTTMLCGGG